MKGTTQVRTWSEIEAGSKATFFDIVTNKSEVLPASVGVGQQVHMLEQVNPESSCRISSAQGQPVSSM